ncbi:MAG: type II secretion system F family protein, partial [Candidatus Saccharimonas sp.]
MRKFNYEARDKATDTIIKSIVQAESEMAAARVLTEQGFVPLDIKEVDESGGLFGSLTRRVTTKDKVVFTRQLATLIGAGLPLSQSLRTVLEQTENKKLQEIIQEIIADVEGGRQLSDSFGKHPEIFDKIYLSLVTAGEASGTLDQALKRVASQQEKDAAMVSKIRGAMTYPAIVLAVIMGVMLFMLLVVVPQVEKLYSDMHKTLPFLTAALIAVAKFTA